MVLSKVLLPVAILPIVLFGVRAINLRLLYCGHPAPEAALFIIIVVKGTSFFIHTMFMNAPLTGLEVFDLVALGHVLLISF